MGIVLLVVYIFYMITFDIPIIFKKVFYEVNSSEVEKLDDGIKKYV